MIDKGFFKGVDNSAHTKHPMKIDPVVHLIWIHGTYPDAKRTASGFNNEEHNEAAEIGKYNECHHVYDDAVKLEDESWEDMLCSKCHFLALA